MGRPVGTESQFQPTEGWQFEVIIGEFDYTDDMISLRIASSLTGVYSIFTLNMLLNPNDILVQQIYGHKSIQLTMRQYGHTGPDNISPISNDLRIELMYISADFNIPISEDIINQISNKDLIPFGMIAVPAIAFRLMTNYSNVLYNSITPMDAILDLTMGDNAPDVEQVRTEFDRSSPNLNETPIPQLIIPPTTLKNGIEYINNNFGVYKGMTSIFCNIDPLTAENGVSGIVLRCLDLSYRMQEGAKEILLNVTQLSNTGEDAIIDAPFNGKDLFTYQPILSEYMANSIYAAEANNVSYIGKPSNSLFIRHDYNLQEFANTEGYGLIDGSDKEVFVNPILRNRQRIDLDTNGYQEDGNGDFNTTQHYSELINKIATLSRLTITMEKDTPIEKLLWIGEPIKFISNTADYVKLTGRYILHSSDIRWEKSTEWQMFSTLKIIRTNRNRAA